MKICEVLDLTKSGKVVYSVSLAVMDVQFGKSKSFKWKRVEVNIHCTALRNDFIGHKIIVMVLSWLNLRTIAISIAWSPAGTKR